MKIKVVIASLAIAIVAVAAFAFTTNSTKSVKLYFYAQGTCKQAITPASGQADCRDNSIGTGNLFKDVNNWSVSSNGTTFVNSNYVSAITFDDSQISLQDALNGAYNYYSTHSSTLPDDNVSFMVGSASVAIRRTAAHY